jgi:DNA-binding SARP family transcriptional activator
MVSPEPPVRIRLLGSFEVGRGDRVLLADAWARKKSAALLQRLAYERRMVKDQAIDFLWPESNLASGSNNLYRVLYSLRQTLDAYLGPGTADEVFSFEDGILHLREDVWVDAAEFQRLSEKIPGELHEQHIARLKEALSLYRGDFLPDERYEEWTLVPREALSRLRQETSLILAKHHFEQRDFSVVISLLSPLLVRDPADEPVHRELMRAYALSGRRHDALRQYQACVDALASDLDAPPGPETTALYDQILRGELAPQPEPDLTVAWSPPVPVSLDPNRASLFTGRQHEVSELSTILHTARQGHGGTVLIAGESGVGKTRLAMEALNLAAGAGMATLLGAAYEQEGRLPFQPFIEAFDHFLSEKGRSLKQNPITHFQHLGSPDPQQEHWALFKATANFILDIARDSSLVFLVDDMHAADETSLQLFHYLARQTRSAPVVLLATYRIDSPTSTQFNGLVNALYREGLSQTITLESLPEEAVKEILEDILDGEASEELCRAVYEITTGNPFFTQEMARALLRLGKVEQSGDCWSLKSGEELSVPDNLSALLRQRVSRLGRGVEVALAAAAVIGREFSFEILRGVVDRSSSAGGPLSNGEILDALDSALAGHFIEETPVGYRFRHPLIRRTLYEGLSRVRRANHHTHSAESIEAIYALRPGGLVQQIEALAYHYDLSDRRDRTLPYLIQAGENAAGVYAFEVAVDYFERALSLIEDLGLPDPDRRWRLLESLGWWHSILADTPRAVSRLEQALALEPGPDWRPASRDLVRLHSGAAVALITAGNMDAAERHLQTALAKMDDREDAPEYADLLYNLAQLHWHKNEYQQSMDVARRSLAIAERLGQPDAIARAYEMLALACHSLGEWQAGIAYEHQRAMLTGAGLDVTDAFDVHL